MARRPRYDLPRSWHHVLNRGLAKRPLFEDRADVRFFLSRLAREVRRGRLEVHAWCVLTTHFHLLVRSPAGELSEALRRAQNEYSRFFNRRHRRDGTLVRGRFLSKPVTSLSYRRTLVRYIDRNPVRAGLARAPWDYPFCSARQYVHGAGPPWLERSWVESAVSAGQGVPCSGVDYVRAFGSPLGDAAVRLVETRLRAGARPSDDLDDLVGSAPPLVLAWMKRKAKLADGCGVGLPVCDAKTVHEVVQHARSVRGEWEVSPTRKRRSAWDLVEVGLLRTLAGGTWEQVARMTGAGISSSQQRYRIHATLMEEEPRYARKVGRLAADALGACHR